MLSEICLSSNLFNELSKRLLKTFDPCLLFLYYIFVCKFYYLRLFSRFVQLLFVIILQAVNMQVHYVVLVFQMRSSFLILWLVKLTSYLEVTPVFNLMDLQFKSCLQKV